MTNAWQKKKVQALVSWFQGTACQSPRDPKCYMAPLFMASCSDSLILHFFICLHVLSFTYSRIFSTPSIFMCIHAFPMTSPKWVYGAGILSFSTLGTKLLLPASSLGGPAQAHQWLRPSPWLTELAGLFQAVL